MTSPAREVLADRNFRGFWLAQTCLAAVNGTLRFTFVWLVVTLTDWSTAEGIVAGCLGLPAVFFSLAAGAWSDRVDRKRMFQAWTLASVVSLGVFTFVVAVGAVSPFWTGIAAFVIGTTVAVSPPNINAMVPLIVPPERLMNAIALQNGAMNAASFSAVILAGVAIEVVGDAGGFALLALLGVGLGGGQFALSLAPSFWVALVVMLAWGINAGLAITSHRTVLQTATQPEMMGRVMGLTMTGFMGGLPVGALVSSLLSTSLEPAMTMRVVGLVTIGLAGALSWRPSIVGLR